MRTLFWHSTGPLVKYGNGYLTVADLNPEKEIAFRMSRWDLLKLSFRAARAALGN